MKKQLNRSELLGSLPVKRAVLMQILPAIASQMVALAYGIADTYFVGLLNDPDKTAAVTVANAAFLMLTALSNLFGIGGASLISRSLGIGNRKKSCIMLFILHLDGGRCRFCFTELQYSFSSSLFCCP